VTTNILWDAPDKDVAGMFANLGTSMWTMFKLMTLENWIGSVEEVTAIKPGMLPFFVFFIFAASIALMSLVPAIFIELNLERRQEDSKKKHIREKDALYKSKERMLRELFRLTDDDGNGAVSVSEMQRILSSDQTDVARQDSLRKLQQSGLTKQNDLRDVKLGLFDLSEDMSEEFGLEDAELSRAEFLKGVLQSWDDVEPRKLWLAITATRKQVRSLTNLVQTELSGLRAAVERLQPNMHGSSAGPASRQMSSASLAGSPMQAARATRGSIG